MTNYDQKPDARHTTAAETKSKTPLIIGGLVAAAIVAGLVIFFDVDQTKEGSFDVDVNAEMPEFDIDGTDIDVEMPEVTLPKISVEGGSVEGGKLDVDLPNEGCEADDISAADCVVPDIDVDVDVDANVDVKDPQ